MSVIVITSSNYCNSIGCIESKSIKEPIVKQNWECIMKKISLLQIYSKLSDYLSCNPDIDCLFTNSNKCCK